MTEHYNRWAYEGSIILLHRAGQITIDEGQEMLNMWGPTMEAVMRRIDEIMERIMFQSDLEPAKLRLSLERWLWIRQDVSAAYRVRFEVPKGE